jgi:hypothetical protein
LDNLRPTVSAIYQIDKEYIKKINITPMNINQIFNSKHGCCFLSFKEIQQSVDQIFDGNEIMEMDQWISNCEDWEEDHKAMIVERRKLND